ncbi:alpha/beta-hydrolase [Hymenopellis radicata]|nr:alpha/beta-hydrolase [Hymenopellis radicata]
MTVSTVSSAVHITPIAIKTFFAHGKRKAEKFKNGEEEEDSKDNIFFDEAFHIVKAFIEMGTKNTVESLQAFTNTHVPAPYWAAVAPVLIPLTSCNRAADILIDWFGPEELKHVVGGERWWQVRGMDGIDAEWITEKEYLSEAKADSTRKLSDTEEDILRMESLDRVMFYIHGGGYFWGSINTHRYQIIRYARKFKGRAFAVNYRKAPQYPWPCPIQDILAAYLYLIQPPPSARHKAIPASKIVFAGDSAGGGLSLTLLTLLRDMGLPMPAGAVLISPWVDLTHSLPSVMNNTPTDIIPPYGFLAKPSPLWPVELLPPSTGRVRTTNSNPPPKPGHADTLKPSVERVEKEAEKVDADLQGVQNQDEMLRDGRPESPLPHEPDQAGPGKIQYNEALEPVPPKVLMKDPNATPLELCSQIQLYATTEQLTHPLVSPLLQGSLGNLPPLYIIAGDGEVLRDEIMYVAHRAAHPAEYPVREGVLRGSPRQRENAKKFTEPTKVHLQVFDGMCHVLTVFTFTQCASYAYRSIAEFVKHVTDHDEKHLDRNPFPELHRPPTDISDHYTYGSTRSKRSIFKRMGKKEDNAKQHVHSQNGEAAEDVKLFKQEVDTLAHTIEKGVAEDEDTNDTISPETGKRDVPNITMIRERVDIHGYTRPMEPKEDLVVLRLRREEIGLIKEAPALRWAKGQDEWDKVFHKTAKKASKKRQKLEAKAHRMLEHAREQGLITASQPSRPNMREKNALHTKSPSEDSMARTIQEDRRWGPLDLENESPPPSSIAKRRDTKEALALLKKSIYHTAPITHETVPRLKTSDVIRAAFDSDDDPVRPPRQSVSEQQVRTHIIPMHGLRIWDVLIGHFRAGKYEEGSKRLETCIGSSQKYGRKDGNHR